MTTTQTHARPQGTPASGPEQARQMVSFTFYRVDPAWRRLPAADRAAQGRECVEAVERSRKDLIVGLSYSLIGLRPDVDFMLWRVAPGVEALQSAAAALLRTGLGAYLTTPHAYLSMTKRSSYVDKLDPDHPDKRRFITPFHSKYLFVYPFVKTHDWYQLPFPERQVMMDEHIVLGNKYPSVRIHTTYAFGLDDPEFVLAFETDVPQDFLDLVMAMRESKGRPYTLKDTPIFTCVAKDLPAILKDLGA